MVKRGIIDWIFIYFFWKLDFVCYFLVHDYKDVYLNYWEVKQNEYNLICADRALCVGPIR